MKKTIKSKLRLNSQTIRTLKEVRGGRPIVPVTIDDTGSDYCTVGCRGCG
jgi:hypothetical protein